MTLKHLERAVVPATASPTATSRRDFLKASALTGAGLVIGFFIPQLGRFAANAQAPAAAPKLYPPNAFLQVRPDNAVIIQVSKVDIGQGTYTSLPMLLAEELDCNWADVQAQHARGEDMFRDPLIGIQMVGGSSSVANSYLQYREIGARARAMLIAAAAQQWGVAASACRTDSGVIMGPAGQRATYGSVAEAAMQIAPPASVQLKDPKTFKLIGKATTRLDTADKSDGAQKFGIDVDLPGMKVAVVARAPVWGAKIKTLDDTAARALRGVVRIFRIPGDHGGESVVVVADGYWSAKKARDALKIDWDFTGVERISTDKLLADYRELAKKPGLQAIKADVSGIAGAPKHIDAVFEFPYLAHTPMEPLNMTISFDGDACTVWMGSQFQTLDRSAIAQVLTIPAERVQFNTIMAGGAFGRRALPGAAQAVEGAHIAKVMRETPVKIIWSREDDVRGGYYRPMHVHSARIGYDAQGKILGWNHVIVGQSLLAGTPFAGMIKDGVDGATTEGVAESQYAIPNLALTVHHPVVNVPVLWWRSVGNTHTAYVMETLIDEIAASVGRDPVEYRRSLFGPESKRSRAALDLAVERSGYGKRKLPAGQAWGVAVHHSFNTSVAYVVEASIVAGRPKVHRVTAGIHCNLVVNPRSLEAQVQGGAVNGLSMLLPGSEITLKDGIVQQSNFTDFRLAYAGDAPPVDVHVVPSLDAPTGIGEPPLPPIAPAVANAVALLTGKRIRKLPFATLGA